MRYFLSQHFVVEDDLTVQVIFFFFFFLNIIITLNNDIYKTQVKTL